jgi:quercetin 2,3-dioxygenase
MITLRPSDARGHANHGWLESWHSFSFGDYHDPAHMGFSDLRVINQDIIQPGKGFGTHGHRDMEIITYVLDGALAHKDSMGNVETIRAGELQRMTAGTGIQHSEFNASDTGLVELLQIWVLPDASGLTPGYEQVLLENRPGWQVIASRTGADGMLRVHQDMTLLRGQFAAGETTLVPVAQNRKAWLQVVRGTVHLDSQTLTSGDAAALTDLNAAAVMAATDAELLLFDLR